VSSFEEVFLVIAGSFSQSRASLSGQPDHLVDGELQPEQAHGSYPRMMLPQSNSAFVRSSLLSSPWLWFICLLLLVLACSGKILGGMLAARAIGESWRDSFSLGTLMNIRGLVELIVLNIGLDLGILSPTFFRVS